MFQDAKDLEWTSDSKLEPVDLNKLDARKFIVYKFGCFVTDLVAGHCQHAPITLLLADKIPPNERLRNNAYRNSFFFDANNRILYVRTARLDTVGEFVVVLVHTLAHIKAGEYLKMCLSLDFVFPATFALGRRRKYCHCSTVCHFVCLSICLSCPYSNSDVISNRHLLLVYDNSISL